MAVGVMILMDAEKDVTELAADVMTLVEFLNVVGVTTLVLMIFNRYQRILLQKRY